MLELTLSHGPKLKYISYPMKKARKVTKVAHQFLFEPLKIEDDVTVNDIFKLLKKDPVLVSIFRRDFAAAFLEHALKQKKTPPSSTLEYIELYTVHSFNSYTRELRIPTHYNVHGVSPILEEDNTEYGAKAGTRMEYGISGTPLAEILDLPLRVRTSVPMSEDDLDSSTYNDTIATNEVPNITLGALIHSLLWELSFHGTPKDTESFFEDLKQQVEDLDNGLIETVSGDDLFDSFDRPGIAAMFDTIGDNSVSKVCRALRKIDNSKSVVPTLKAAFGNTVVVKEEFRKMPAREFRRTFRGFSH